MGKILLIVIGIIVLIIAGVIAYQLLKQEQPKIIKGEESLEIRILGPDNNSIKNIEVDLWTSEDSSGPPNAGFLMTDSQGIVLFKIPSGQYLIGFNGYNFPEEFIFPEKTPVIVDKGKNYKTIILESKE